MISYEAVYKLVARLNTDARCATGPVQAYARQLLADLDVPAPADPEALRRGISQTAMSQPAPDPFDAAPRVGLDVGEFGIRAFAARYSSRCAAEQDDWMDEGEMIILTPLGYMHLECARDEYPDEIAEIEKRNA